MLCYKQLLLRPKQSGLFFIDILSFLEVRLTGYGSKHLKQSINFVVLETFFYLPCALTEFQLLKLTFLTTFVQHGKDYSLKSILSEMITLPLHEISELFTESVLMAITNIKITKQK